MAAARTPARHSTKAPASAAGPPEDLDLLRDRIELFLAEHPRLLLSEPGREVMDLSDSSYSLSTEYNKLIWHVWNDRTNLVRHITAIARERPGRLELSFQRYGKGPAGKLILADTRADADRLERRGRRVEFAGLLRRWLAQLFPDSRIEGITTEQNLKDSLSGCYARGLLRGGGRSWAVIGVSSDEDPAVIDGMLTYGIIWLDRLRREHPSRLVAGLKLFVPEGFAETARQRMAWLNHDAAVWELYETGSEIVARDCSDTGNLKTSLQPRKQEKDLGALDEKLARRMEQLSDRVASHTGSDGLRRWSIAGLVIARQREAADGRQIVFGLGRAETELNEPTLDRLRRLARQVLQYRSVSSSAQVRARHHPLYRLFPELWMQSVILGEAEKVWPDLLPGARPGTLPGILPGTLKDALYRQVFTTAGRESGIADLLGITRSGRLVVMELKASEDIQLPLQGLDYWMRVRWHQQRGEFAARGYFPGIPLSAESPKLMLVSPGLQFHSTCQTVLRYLSQQVDVEMTGLNEGWREQLQVVFRKSREDFRRSE